LSVDGCRSDRGDRSDNAEQNLGATASLVAQSSVVDDAQLHALDQVVALDQAGGAGDQSVSELLVEGHGAAVATGSAMCASSDLMPRVRWVLTEFREMSRVSAISSMPSSS